MSKKKHKSVHGGERQEKKKQFQSPEPEPKRKNGQMIGMILVIAAAIAVLYLLFGSVRSQNLAAVTTEGQDVRIPIAQFKDGQARFYTYTPPGGRQIKFFVVQSSDGIIRAAFDACDVCFKHRKGYRQMGDDMVCINCGKHFPSVSVNEIKGGCNPAPLHRTIQGNDLVIRMNDLQQGAYYF